MIQNNTCGLFALLFSGNCQQPAILSQVLPRFFFFFNNFTEENTQSLFREPKEPKSLITKRAFTPNIP
jgi:hypothetical protein